MTTIKITVDNQKHGSQYQKLKYILEKYSTSKLFKDIKDPAKWQKKLRNEWK